MNALQTKRNDTARIVSGSTDVHENVFFLSSRQTAFAFIDTSSNVGLLPLFGGP